MSLFKTTVLMVMAGLAGNAALASDAPDAPLQKTVSFADLDLSNTADAQSLHRRLHAAAKQVCAPADGATAVQKRRYHACVDKALSNAVVQVNQPALSAVHASKSGSKSGSARVASAR